ncbi:MAG: GNAT family acetyltransferase [Pseudomonadota bacterium]
MKLGTYEDRHFAGVDELWRRCFPDDPPRNRAEHAIPAKLAVEESLGKALFVVAENEDCGVIGTAMAGYDGHRGWLYAVAVSPDHRRLGIGAALVEEACIRLRSLGCNKLNLQVRARNEAVAAFYKSLGFEIELRISMGRQI